MDNLFKRGDRKRKPTVHYPVELDHTQYVGPLYGYFHADSNDYNVVDGGLPDAGALPAIGRIVADHADEAPVGNELMGTRRNGELSFRQGDRLCKKEPYELLLNIFSRNSGILESNVMLGKRAVISGVGSVGSLVALELARSGVGYFLLIDQDTFAYHNICRHQCGVSDVGKFKVAAVRERILDINPWATVETHAGIIEEVPQAVFDAFLTPGSVIVGCADNREGDLYANRISALYRIPFVSIGFWERAYAGEIFYSIPGKTPCYACVFGSTGQEMSARQSTNRRFYTNEEDVSMTRFEPGISTDINFVTTIGVKLTLDLLNLETPDYVSRLLNHLSQFTLICNTNDPRIGGNQAEIFSYPLQVTRSIKIDYAEACPTCRLANGVNHKEELALPHP